MGFRCRNVNPDAVKRDRPTVFRFFQKKKYQAKLTQLIFVLNIPNRAGIMSTRERTMMKTLLLTTNFPKRASKSITSAWAIDGRLEKWRKGLKTLFSSKDVFEGFQDPLKEIEKTFHHRHHLLFCLFEFIRSF